ncbi:MAG: YoaK family protein [Niabella sp.]
MLRHRGKRRTFVHNIKLASMLSFVAGIVNITGVLCISVLTTNVTGHFAYFAEEISLKNYSNAVSFLLFIFSFLLGSFVSNFLTELAIKKRLQMVYAAPMVIEIAVLAVICFMYYNDHLKRGDTLLIACGLLFAMGIQNALVTKASQSVVRTTHLTGLFTDLGIELSQLFFYKQQSDLKKLSKNIYLKLAIIGFFFAGCVAGGLIYKNYQLHTLLIAIVSLLFATFYDSVRFWYYSLKRKVQYRN